jgi:hypothetical protein
LVLIAGVRAIVAFQVQLMRFLLVSRFSAGTNFRTSPRSSGSLRTFEASKVEGGVESLGEPVEPEVEGF